MIVRTLCVYYILTLRSDELGTLAVQTYLYDSMADIGDRLEILAKEFIPAFKEIGIEPLALILDAISQPDV